MNVLVNLDGTDGELSQLAVASHPSDPDLIVLLDFEGPNADFALLQALLEEIHRGVPVMMASPSL